MQRLRLTIVQGFVGAGKSAVCGALLADSGERRVKLLPYSGLVGLCVELRRVSVEGQWDHVVVKLRAAEDESTLSEAWHSTVLDDFRLSDAAEVTCVVTVVDAQRFLFDLSSEAPASAHGVRSDEGGSQRVAPLLARQVESADVLVLAKADRVSREQIRLLQAVLAELNPAAQIVVGSHGHVPSAHLLDGRLPQLASIGTGRSDVFAPSARDRASLGVCSVEYRAHRPFHPARLRQHLLSGWPGVLRSKGIFWLATRMTEVGAWSQVGPVWEVSRAGFWWSALEEQGWPIPTGIQEQVRATWREPFGDRRQDLVLTGLDIDRRELHAGFEACLLTEEEIGRGPEAWQLLEDPFGSWSVQR